MPFSRDVQSSIVSATAWFCQPPALSLEANASEKGGHGVGKTVKGAVYSADRPGCQLLVGQGEQWRRWSVVVWPFGWGTVRV